MTKVEYYTRNKKVYHYYPTENEAKEISKQKRKISYAMKMADKELMAQYKYEHQGGYCPKCFLLRPITGICPTCN